MPPVLAIEPDPAQAEVLRRSVQARIKAELLVVATTDDAMKAIGRDIPDLILVSTLLSPRDEDRLFHHLRSLSGASHLQTLTIPQLRRGRETSRKGALGRFRKKTTEATPSGCDPAVFAEEVSSYLARARETKSHVVEVAAAFNERTVAALFAVGTTVSEDPAASPAPAAGSMGTWETPSTAVAAPVETPSMPEPTTSVFDETPIAPLEPSSTPPENLYAAPDFSSLTIETNPFEHGAGSFERLEPIAFEERADSEPDRLAEALAPLPEIPEPTRRPDLPDIAPDTWIDLDIDALAQELGLGPGKLEIAEDPAETKPKSRRGAKSSLNREAESQARLEAETQARREAEAQAQREAEARARLEAETQAQLEAEAHARREAEALAKREADARRELEAQAKREGEARREAEAQARRESEARAKREAEAKAQIEAEAQARRDAEAKARREEEARLELEAKARREAEAQAKREAEAQAQREAEAKARREAEAAAKREAEARREAEAQAKRETEARREAEAQAKKEAQARKAAEAQAKKEAEAQAHREAELKQAQADAQARLATEVERVQREGEKRRQAELNRIQAEAEAERQAAVSRARAEAEAEARKALNVELARARETVAAESAQAMTEELARVRAEVEEKLNKELSRARAEADQLRKAELQRAHKEAATLRTAAAEQARRAAEAEANLALEAEVTRVRAEAEARLQTELATVRKQAEHARRADQSEAKQTVEKVRQAAIRDTRAITEAANQTLEAELKRVRTEAERRLTAELARARSQAEEQRALELEAIRSQVTEMKDAAAAQARSATAQAIAAAVPQQAPRAYVDSSVRSGHQHGLEAGDYYSLWQAQLARDQPPPSQVPIEEPKEEEEEEEEEVERRSLREMLASIPLPSKKQAAPIAAGLLLLVGVSTALSWRPAPKPPAPVVEPVEKPIEPIIEVPSKTGEIDVESSPAGVKVTLDGTVVGVTPIKLPKLKPGRHIVILQGPQGTVTRRVDVRTGQVTRVSESIFSGWLTVFSGIPVKLYVNRQLKGSSDDGQIMFPPGTYDVELVNERFNFRETQNFIIEPGRVTKYSVQLPAVQVYIDSPDGVEITVDGQPAGRTPVDRIVVPIGTHEIVGITPTGERRQSVEVKAGEQMRISFR